MNERSSPAVLVLLGGSPAIQASSAGFKNGRSYLECLIDETLMVVSESFITFFHTFFSLPEWKLAPSIYPEISELCTLFRRFRADPLGFQ